MKNQKRYKLTAVMGLLSMCLFCSCLELQKTTKKVTDPPITIWIGSAAVASGHKTHRYEEKDGWIIWVAGNGNERKTPVSSIYYIEQNGQEQ